MACWGVVGNCLESTIMGFRSFVWVEGFRMGKEGIEPTPEQLDADDARNLATWKSEQAGFRRLRENTKSIWLPFV